MCITPLLSDLFNALPPIQLVAMLAHHQPSSYPLWLNNDAQSVIGILPKHVFKVTAPTVGSHFDDFMVSECTRRAFATDNLSDCYDEQSSIKNLSQLQQTLTDYQYHQSLSQNQSKNVANVSDLQRYINGWLGFISYDISAKGLAQSDEANYLKTTQPLAYFGHYDSYLTYQNLDGNYHWQLHTTTQIATDNIDKIQQFLTDLIKKDKDFVTNPLILSPVWDKTQYQTAFDKVQDYLTAGDCYQINLTQCWQGQLTQRLSDYLPQLHRATQAPFAGYLAVDRYELLSCSPELFFTFDKDAQGDTHIVTKPIKGTRPRGTTPTQDEALKSELATSEKDTAENVMIVDLLRNDLGKYAKTGTVAVPKLFAIESFSNVHHMVSTVTATLKDDVHPLTVLFGSLPAGSITGTPKKRAVEIIHELEAQPRGAYCGTMGYLNFDGTGQWNVLIRTLQADDKGVTLWAGGGITIASECDAEYQECFDKVGNLLTILQDET